MITSDNSHQISEEEPGVIALKGDITTAQVSELIYSGQSLLLRQPNSKCIIDWAQVESVDSSTLALALHWLKYAKTHKLQLTHIHMPESMRKLAEISGVKKLIFDTDNEI